MPRDIEKCCENTLNSNGFFALASFSCMVVLRVDSLADSVSSVLLVSPSVTFKMDLKVCLKLSVNSRLLLLRMTSSVATLIQVLSDCNRKV